MFLLQIVFSPAAEINTCRWQDTHWSCSSERPPWQDPLVTVLRFMLLGHWRPCQLQEGDFWEERQLNGGHSPGWCPNTLCSVGLCQLRPESRRKYTGPQGLGQQEEMLLLGVVCCCKQENPKLAAYVHSGRNEPKGDAYNSELLQEHLKTKSQNRNLSWAWVGGHLGGEWIYVFVWLIPFAVHIKQYC